MWLSLCLMWILIAIVVLSSLVVCFVILNSTQDSIPHRFEHIFSFKFVRITLSPIQKMLTKLTFACFILIVLLALFLSTFFHLLDTDYDQNNQFKLQDQTVIKNDPLIIDDKYQNIFWFVHLSDIHLSHLKDKNRLTDLVEFCRVVLPIIQAPVLVLTGDLIDARTRLPLGSDQYHEEWKMYRQAREECLKYNPNLIWLDIRGNHDNFNVLKDYQNFFANYTVQSGLTKDGKSYRYEVKTNDGNRYSFIGADACLYPGIKRPFNFVGQFSQEELKKLENFRDLSSKTNYTIWYGHYPTGSIYNKDSFRKLINGPYLCGHYHTINQLVMSMVSTQPQGFLEAETGDWKDVRVFRIAAIDHGLFTFSNFNYMQNRETPLLVITNPRSVLHQMENLEPFWRTQRSTSIRVLIFSHAPIVEAKAFVSSECKFAPENVIESYELKNVRDALWVSHWSPEKYKEGLYYMTVIASDEQHNSNQMTVPFSMDRTKPKYSFLGRLILRFDFRTITMFLFAWGFFFATIPLIFLRILIPFDDLNTRHMFNQSRRSYMQKVIFRLYLLSHQNRLFIPLILLPFYTLFGPWFLAYLVSDHIGVVFAWGTLIDGVILPSGFTFVFSAIFIFIFHLPFIMCLSILLNIRYKALMSDKRSSSTDSNAASNSSQKQKISQKVFNQTNFYVIVLVAIAVFQGVSATLFYFAYGFLAFITNFYLGISVVYLFLIRNVLKYNPNSVVRLDIHGNNGETSSRILENSSDS